MALDVKKIIASEFMELCETKDLRKITIGDIQEKVGLSRQTFYKHFKDKDDLIQYCYDTKIVPAWHEPDGGFESDEAEWSYTYEWTLRYMKSIKRHKKFMKAACSMNGPNCLWQHMKTSDIKNENEWFKETKGLALTKEQTEILEYHCMAYYGMTVEWVLDDMPISETEFVEKIMRVSAISFERIFGEQNKERFYGEIFKKMKN